MSCKTDCYWYHEDQDMNAMIPECKARKLYPLDERDCEKCNKYHSKLKQTNADRIRSMTDEDLAEFLSRAACGCAFCGMKEECMDGSYGYDDADDNCTPAKLDWLKQEAEE